MRAHDRPAHAGRTLALSSLLVGLLFVGCADSMDPIDGWGWGSPPETRLTYAPLEGDTASVRIHVYWYGFDRDGEVVRYRVAMDADTMKAVSSWAATSSLDTTLTLSVDRTDPATGHVIWVSSEDNEGLFDPTPAKRFFSVKTVPPISRIVSGAPLYRARVGPAFTIAWEGTDPDGGVTGGPVPADSFEILLLRPGTALGPGEPALPFYSGSLYERLINEATGATLLPPFETWSWVGTRARAKRFTGMPPGTYVFAVRAVDAAGAIETGLIEGRNFGSFTVSASGVVEGAGPLLTVCGDPLTRCLTGRGLLVGLPEIGVIAGDPVSFSWSATSDAYGESIAGYSVALDDTLGPDWRAVEPGTTEAIVAGGRVTPGPHVLFVRAIDGAGLQSIAVLRLRAAHPAFRDPGSMPSILIVDDSVAPPGGPIAWNLGSPNFPSDADQDDWWRRVIRVPLAQEFGVVTEEWDTTVHGLYSGTRVPPALADLVRHRVILWRTDLSHTLSSPSALWRTLIGEASSPLAVYLRAGGTLIVTGFEVGYQAATPAWNLGDKRGLCSLEAGTVTYRLTYFVREFMGLEGAVPSDAGLRTQGARDFVSAMATSQGLAMGFRAAEVDTGDTETGAKWDPRGFSGIDGNESYAPGLPKVEGWTLQTAFACGLESDVRREDPSRPIASPIYTYHGVPRAPSSTDPYALTGAPSPREGLVVGIATQAHDFGASGGGALSAAPGAVGRMVFLGFPIDYAKDAQAYAVVRNAFAYVVASPTLRTAAP